MKINRRFATVLGAVLFELINVGLIVFFMGLFFSKIYKDYDALRYTSFSMAVLCTCTFGYITYLLIHYKEKIYDKLFDAYHIIGILNKEQLYPDEVQVILEKKGKYYIQDYNIFSGVLVGLTPLNNSLQKEVLPLSEFNFTKFEFPNLILGDKAFLGFQYDTNKVFIGPMKELEVFMSNFNNMDNRA